MHFVVSVIHLSVQGGRLFLPLYSLNSSVFTQCSVSHPYTLPNRYIPLDISCVCLSLACFVPSFSPALANLLLLAPLDVFHTSLSADHCGACDVLLGIVKLIVLSSSELLVFILLCTDRCPCVAI